MANERSRVFRTSNKSKASVLLKDDEVSIIGDDKNFVTVDSGGTTIRGPVSIVADGQGIRLGGLFVMQNQFLNMVPSTIITPIPQVIPIPPIFAAVTMAQDVSFFMSLLI